MIESIIGFETLKSGIVPGTKHFQETEVKVSSNLSISGEKQEIKGLKFLLKNSFGFGGVNNSILFQINC